MGTCSCCSGNRKVKRGLWSPEEDHKLKDFVNKHGHKIWSQVPIKAGLERCGKSCRLRWLNYLRPGIKRGKFSPQEQELIFDLQTVYGNRWSWISKWLPGRTDTEIKNFWKVLHQKRSSNSAVPLRLHIYDPKPELDFEDESNKCEASAQTQVENKSAEMINPLLQPSPSMESMDDFESDICWFYDELPDLMLLSGDIC